jgi:transcriptional regulator with XRE-family HTH domain
MVPNAVVGLMVKEGLTAVGAWRRYLDLSQQEVAERIGITQPAYAQHEQAAKPRKATREKIAVAFGIAPELLEL